MTQSAKFYDTIARFYDAENAAKIEDLDLYSELADETSDPILDVGCGTGRVMLALAREGFNVVGVDNSEAMLARGERALDAAPDLKPLVTFVKGDVLTTALAGPFKLILVPYNTFMHFNTQEHQIAALRRFHALLDDDGLLVLDLPNAGEAFGTQDDDAVTLERLFTEPESGHLVMQQSFSTLDRISQQLHVTWIYDEITADGTVRRTLAPLLLRYVFSGELDLLLALTGFGRVETYGDYQQEAFIEGSSRMIVLAEKVSGK